MIIMATDITIPREAEEAAARAAYNEFPLRRLNRNDFNWVVIPWDEVHPEKKRWCYAVARAACLAMLKAWPNTMTATVDDTMLVCRPTLILPLTEKPE